MRTITKSAAETRALGERIAARLQPGDVLLLEGGLGAGKSELTRGIAKGLGVTETVTSPSFTILNVYDSGRCPLYHFDWYRLESAEELYELGMDEYLGGDGIAAVEWPDMCPEAVPEDCLEITLEPAGEETRHILLRPRGAFRFVPAETEKNRKAAEGEAEA
jgi:tRNA threonylcarbamoyladenosine biosynthesis protein TsaE